MASQVFSLEGKCLKLDSAEDIGPYIESLKDCDVREAYFPGNTLGVGACKALAQVLADKKNLEIINLADIFTGRLLSEIPPSLEALLEALLTLPKLHTVNLNDNAFGLNTVEPLLTFLSAHTPLQHLHLNNNGMGPIAGNRIGQALAALGEKKKQTNAEPLRTIVCGRNRLENGSMPGWIKAFSHNTQVTSIRMVQNGIRPEGVSSLLREGLTHVKCVQVFDLEDNTFTGTGARALANIIGGWLDLEELALNDCYLSAKGWIMIAEALKAGKNKKLKVLKLQFNNIDSKGVQLLADNMPRLPNIRQIELNGNKFHEDDVSITRLRDTLDQRKDGAGASEDNDTWGLDELDELDDESEDEDEQEGQEGQEEHKEGLKAPVGTEMDAETAPVRSIEDQKVDQLADLLGKTKI